MSAKVSDVRGLLSGFQKTLADVENLVDSSGNSMFNAEELREFHSMRSDLAKESARLDAEFEEFEKSVRELEDKEEAEAKRREGDENGRGN